MSKQPPGLRFGLFMRIELFFSPKRSMIAPAPIASKGFPSEKMFDILQLLPDSQG